MRILFVIMISSLLGNNLLAQEKKTISNQEAMLVQLSAQFLKDSVKENRIAAAKNFNAQLELALKGKNSFTYPFEKLETVSILYPADSTFRIFTWQLYVDKNDYRYGGIIQMNQPSNDIFVLNDQSNEVAAYDLEYDILGPDDWYGAIYFSLKGFDTPKGKQYLLFGFDGFEFFNKRKVAEALYFDENNQPVFGAPAFAKVSEGYEAATQNRLYLEYSAEIAARLNYDPNLDMIIADNMIAMRSPYKGVGNVNIPDGSYTGYKLNNGVWEYVDKVFDLVSERPPSDGREVSGSNKKDLFGKAVKDKKRDKKQPFKN